MNLIELLATIVGHLTWPATLVVIVFLLRKPIIELLPALRKLKFKEFELEFKDRLQKIESDKTKSINELEEDEDSALLKSRDYYFELAEISPRSAIMEVWLEIESAASDLFRKEASTGMKAVIRNPREVLSYLKDQKKIDDFDFIRVEELHRLRNKAANENEFSEIDANIVAQYVDLSIMLAKKLRPNQSG